MVSSVRLKMFPPLLSQRRRGLRIQQRRVKQYLLPQKLHLLPDRWYHRPLDDAQVDLLNQMTQPKLPPPSAATKAAATAVSPPSPKPSCGAIFTRSNNLMAYEHNESHTNIGKRYYHNSPIRPSKSSSSDDVVGGQKKKKSKKSQEKTQSTTSKSKSGTNRNRLPSLSNLGKNWENEFLTSGDDAANKDHDVRRRSRLLRRNQWIESNKRITKMAIERVIAPPTLHLLGFAACATLTIGCVEATLLCKQWPFIEDYNTGIFVVRYSLEQLFPSVVWCTQDANLIVTALGYDDPTIILRDVTTSAATTTATTSPEAAAKGANLVLQTQLLATSRYFWAGFMMIAQLVRAANISMGAITEYHDRIRLGREPPLEFCSSNANTIGRASELVVRLCGKDSHVSEVSLSRMGIHFFPVYEDPKRVEFLLWKQKQLQKDSKSEKRGSSQNILRPIYWCVRPDQYGSLYAWDRFPIHPSCFITVQAGQRRQGGNDGNDHTNKVGKILVLEADATNPNDPLTIGNAALDLTIEDTSQGFRRIIELYHSQYGLIPGKDFTPLRVYLGNSMETNTTGGGHTYTLRHRVQYAKEVDVLIDSRAPVLHEILKWCNDVVGPPYQNHKFFFQTSSREYFLNLQHLLHEQYGYEIYDPLDLRMLHKLRSEEEGEGEAAGPKVVDDDKDVNSSSLLAVLMSDPTINITPDDYSFEDHRLFLERVTAEPSPACAVSSKEMLRKVAKLAKLPRLVHMKNTSETVNAVEALVMAGEVDVTNCCALIDRQDGVHSLERSLRQRSSLIENEKFQWSTRIKAAIASANTNDDDKEEDKGEDAIDHSFVGGLRIICSSSIHDEMFRQVRQWARMGYTSSEIQYEIDQQYQQVLDYSHQTQQEVMETLSLEESNKATSSSSSLSSEDEGKTEDDVVDGDDEDGGTTEEDITKRN